SALRPPRPRLVPYTTLFRSRCQDRVNCRVCRYNFYKTDGRGAAIKHALSSGAKVMTFGESDWSTVRKKAYRDGVHDYIKIRKDRSEEHTSELQSRENLVCSL